MTGGSSVGAAELLSWAGAGNVQRADDAAAENTRNKTLGTTKSPHDNHCSSTTKPHSGS
jgi:hypothetical protein